MKEVLTPCAITSGILVWGFSINDVVGMLTIGLILYTFAEKFGVIDYIKGWFSG